MPVLAAALSFFAGLFAQEDGGGDTTILGLNIVVFIALALAIVALLLWLFGRRGRV